MSKHPQEGDPDAVARIRAALEESARVKRELARDAAAEIAQAAEWIAAAYRSGGKTLLFGNGGSASDAQHIAAEFTGRLRRDRPALPAIALTANSSDLTAIGNDYSYDEVFAKQVRALGRAPDVLLAISTSGGSTNVVRAIVAAHEKDMTVVALTGRDGGAMAGLLRDQDVEIRVPAQRTCRVQEVHLLVLHCLCDLIDAELLGG